MPTVEKLRARILAIGDVATMLAEADAGKKAAVYADLGLTLTYRQADRVLVAEESPVYVARVAPVYVARVGGGT